MARTLQEVLETHLGKQQWNAISLAFQVEQEELKNRELALKNQELEARLAAKEAPADG